MKRLSIFLMLSLVLFTSCTRDDYNQNAVPEEKSRIVFKSTDDFVEVYQSLARMNMTDLESWVKSKNINSLLYVDDKKDEHIKRVSADYVALFNNEYEFQIQDTIIWYDEGKLYIVAESKDDNVRANKENPSQLKVFAESTIYTDEDSAEIPKTRSIATIDFNRSALHQYGFNWDLAQKGKRYKYVYGLEWHQDVLVYNKRMLYKAVLHLKMEWRKNSYWPFANEVRDAYVNINGFASLYNSTGTNTFYTDRIFLKERRRISHHLKNCYYVLASANVDISGYKNSSFWPKKWFLQVDGNIEQIITTDAKNQSYHALNVSTLIWNQ